jgi:hypothetical protein
MPSIFHANQNGVLVDNLVVHLTDDDPPSRASFLKLKRQLIAKWPINSVELGRPPLRMKKPIQPGTLGTVVTMTVHEIRISFSNAVRDSAAVVTIGRFVRDWWKANINPNKPQKGKNRSRRP